MTKSRNRPVNRVRFRPYCKSLLRELEEMQEGRLGTTEYEGRLRAEILVMNFSTVDMVADLVTYLKGLETTKNWFDSHLPQLAEDILEGSISIKVP